ncbi:MAG: hypothetical protein Q7T05_01075 [Dehalococcoidia bacterium]|nr:hypothetical protein [Dehalococcoidia bacterium]
MSHRVRLKGTLKNRGKHRNMPLEHRLPWEEKVVVSKPGTKKTEETKE